jgi:hypothetical protein
MTDSLAAIMHCPACKAEQVWSNECRRCRADLSLLRGATEAARRAERECLAALSQADFAKALAAAQQAFHWSPRDCNRRRLAICSLLCGDYRLAIRLLGHAAQR